MFADSDPANRGRDSLEMLGIAVGRVSDAGFKIAHIDVTVIAEAPKLAPYRSAMQQALGRVLSLANSDLSIKGKTNEGMGWIGRGEGIACIAIASLAPDEPLT